MVALIGGELQSVIRSLRLKIRCLTQRKSKLILQRLQLSFSIFNKGALQTIAIASAIIIVENIIQDGIFISRKKERLGCRALEQIRDKHRQALQSFPLNPPDCCLFLSFLLENLLL